MEIVDVDIGVFLCYVIFGKGYGVLWIVELCVFVFGICVSGSGVDDVVYVVFGFG